MSVKQPYALILCLCLCAYTASEILNESNAEHNKFQHENQKIHKTSGNRFMKSAGTLSHNSPVYRITHSTLENYSLTLIRKCKENGNNNNNNSSNSRSSCSSNSNNNGTKKSEGMEESRSKRKYIEWNTLNGTQEMHTWIRFEAEIIHKNRRHFFLRNSLEMRTIKGRTEREGDG